MRGRIKLFLFIVLVGLNLLQDAAASSSASSFASNGINFHFPASFEDAKKDFVATFKATASASKDFFVGATAGGIASFTVFPIDLAKTRMQDQIVIVGKTPKYTNTFQTLAKVAQNEGFRGLYSGVFPVVIGTAPSSALQLGCNNQAKSWFAHRLNVDVVNLPFHFEVLAGAFAGMCQVAAANPMESVKVIKQVQGHKAGSTMTIVRQMGVGGLYQVNHPEGQRPPKRESCSQSRALCVSSHVCSRSPAHGCARVLDSTESSRAAAAPHSVRSNGKPAPPRAPPPSLRRAAEEGRVLLRGPVHPSPPPPSLSA